MVASRPASAAAAAASTASRTGRPAATASRRAPNAGPSASTIVLSPGLAWPRSMIAASAASSAATSCSGPNVGSSPRARPARRSAEPHSGPLAPPTAETRVRPASTSWRPGARPSSASSARTTASKPRVMLVPWSPSPIAASSWTRWSRSARIEDADPFIQVVMVAAFMTVSPTNTRSSPPPPQRGSVDRRVPELGQLVVQLEHGERGACHLQRRDVVADQVPRHLVAALTQPALHLAVQQVQLDRGGAAHPVDERQQPGAGSRRQVGDDRLDRGLGDLAGGGERRAAPARL